MFSRILVPLDGSKVAEESLDYARPLAERNRATLSLTRSVAMPVAVGAYGAYGAYEAYPLPAGVIEEELKAAQDYLDRLAEHLRGQGFVVETASSMTDAETGILATADEECIDLIVMTSHGRTGISRFLMGSVAERVCRHAGCPVLIVGRTGLKAKAQAAETTLFRKILIPLDGSPEAEKALDYLSSVASSSDAMIYVLRVLEKLPPLGGVVDSKSFIDAQVELDVAPEKLVEGYLRTRGFEVHSHTETGNATDQILGFAERERCDLILMTSHGRSGASRFFIGSVAERVARHATCPVLVVGRSGSGAGKPEPAAALEVATAT
jgi:nucleotide-binding universal stress UspA family protein